MSLIIRVATLLAALVTGVFATYLFQLFLLTRINAEDLHTGILTDSQISKNTVRNEITEQTVKIRINTDGNTGDKVLINNKNNIGIELESSELVSNSKKTGNENLLSNDVVKSGSKSVAIDNSKSIDKKISVVKNKENKKKPNNVIPKKKNVVEQQTVVNTEIINKITTKKNQLRKSKELLEPELTAAETGFGIDYLLKYYWLGKNKPVVFLPSSLNSCSIKSNKLICNSETIEEDRSGQLIIYKVKSIISRRENTVDRFQVVYRNLVLDVKNTSKTTTNTVVHVKTGWSKKHTVDCQYTGNDSISCIKNGVHKMDIAGKHTR